MKTFTTTVKVPREFAVDDDVFHCAPDMPAGSALILAKIAGSSDTGRVQMIGEFMDTIILPQDAEKFAARLTDPVRPITLEMYGSIIEWVMEEYGVRPTQPSVSSAAGLVPTGTGSTDGAQPMV